MEMTASRTTIKDYLTALEDLLKKVIRHGGFALDYAIRKLEPDQASPEKPRWVVAFSGPDTDLLLEKNAALLDALEFVLLRAVRLDEEVFCQVSFDCGDWRRIRAEELKLTAQMAAERVSETGTRFEMSPMSARERRIVHLALKDQPRVRTVSEGSGSDRRVVIVPAAPSSPR